MEPQGEFDTSLILREGWQFTLNYQSKESSSWIFRWSMSVILEHKSGYQLGPEEAMLAQYLKNLGVDFKIAALSNLERGRVEGVGTAELVVGSIPFVKAALRHRGVKPPKEQSYPPELRYLLHRRIWPSTVRKVRESLELYPKSFFVKPSERAKRFTGFVIFDSMDPRLGGVPQSEKVWCSEVVAWESEWRLYVAHGRVLHQGHYHGNPSLKPSPEVVEGAVTVMCAQPGNPAAFALDLGVISTGETALVEVNDAYGLGAYGIEAEVYYSFLKARWDELCSQPIAYTDAQS